jgi:hypothetical protein
MSDNDIDFADDSWTVDCDECNGCVDASALADITALARKARKLEREIERKKEELKALEKQYRAVVEGDLVTAFEAAGVESFTTADGIGIEVKEELYASIPKKNKPQCAAWLVSHGQAHILSCDLVLQYSRGDRESATALAKELAERGLKPAVKEDMNTASVKTLLKEMRSEGADVPLNLFGAYVLKRAKITGAD